MECSLNRQSSTNSRSLSEARYRLPPSEIVRELVDLYLYYMHDKPHSLFHGRKLQQAIENGTAPRALIFSIMALSARYASAGAISRTVELIVNRFSSDAELAMRGPVFAEAARSHLKDNLEYLCIENIQAAVLITEYAGAQYDRTTEAIYFTIAARMTQLQQLESASQDEPQIDRELRCRVWSSCYMIDVWSSAGLGLPRILDRGPNFQPLMDEGQFQGLPHNSNTTTPCPSIWAEMIRLAEIFAGVQRFHRQILNPHGSEYEVNHFATDLSKQFDLWVEGLPQSLTMEEGNLRSHIRRGTGQSLVALHLGFHHYATLLYFHYLDRAGVSSQEVSSFADRCKYHAAALSDITRMSLERPGCEALYHIAGHMVTTSSSVLLYTFLFGQDLEMDIARERLKVNFAKLMELGKYWSGTAQYVRLGP